jgi:hemoglobin
MEAAMDAVAVSEEAEIDEPMIAALVDAFYADIRRDLLLAPIFDSRIHDWDAHLRQMRAFWSSVMLKTGRYHGTPMQKHMVLPVEHGDFSHWLGLFRAAARRECGAAADRFIAAAERIAASLEMGVDMHRGRLPEPPGLPR